MSINKFDLRRGLMFSVLALTLPLVLLAETAEPDSTFAEWPYYRPISLPELNETALVRLPLPIEAGLGAYNFRDLRVSQDGQEHPFQLLTETAEESQLFASGRILEYSINPAGDRQFLIEISPNFDLHNAVRLTTPERNFRANVEIRAADKPLPIGDNDWRQLRSDGYIFSFWDEQTNRQTGSFEVSYPETAARYLKVLITKEDGEALDVERVQIQQRLAREGRQDSFTVPAEVSHDQERNLTYIEPDLNTGPVLSSQLELKLDTAQNFHRPVMIQTRSNDRWQTRHRSEIFLIETDRFQGRHLTISYPELTTDRLRVVIDNRDNQPLSISSEITLSADSRALIFQADPRSNYRLYYGREQAQAPSYDLEQYFEFLDLQAIATAQLNPEQPNLSFRPEPETVTPLTERHRFLLDIVLILLAITVAGVIGLYLYRHKVSPRAETEQPLDHHDRSI